MHNTHITRGGVGGWGGSNRSDRTPHNVISHVWAGVAQHQIRSDTEMLRGLAGTCAAGATVLAAAQHNYSTSGVSQPRPKSASGATDVIVVGAGVVGVTSAYFLSSFGYRVCVVNDEELVCGPRSSSSGYAAPRPHTPSEDLRIDNHTKRNTGTRAHWECRTRPCPSPRPKAFCTSCTRRNY